MGIVCPSSPNDRTANLPDVHQICSLIVPLAIDDLNLNQAELMASCKGLNRDLECAAGVGKRRRGCREATVQQDGPGI